MVSKHRPEELTTSSGTLRRWCAAQLYGDTRDKPRFDLRPSRRRYASRENFIFVTAEIHQLDSLTIECDLERIGMFQSTDLLDSVGPQFRPDLALGVNGEVVLNHHSAECEIRPKLWANTVEQIGGLEHPDTLEVTFDGQRIKLVNFGGHEDEVLAAGVSAAARAQIEARVISSIPI